MPTDEGNFNLNATPCKKNLKRKTQKERKKKQKEQKVYDFTRMIRQNKRLFQILGYSRENCANTFSLNIRRFSIFVGRNIHFKPSFSYLKQNPDFEPLHFPSSYGPKSTSDEGTTSISIKLIISSFTNQKVTYQLQNITIKPATFRGPTIPLEGYKILQHRPENCESEAKIVQQTEFRLRYSNIKFRHTILIFEAISKITSFLHAICTCWTVFFTVRYLQRLAFLPETSNTNRKI